MTLTPILIQVNPGNVLNLITELAGEFKMSHVLSAVRVRGQSRPQWPECVNDVTGTRDGEKTPAENREVKSEF